MADAHSSVPARDPVGRLPMLVELFYGFAIANGLAEAVRDVIKSGILFSWLFFSAAFLLGLGEWLAYHIHVSHVRYQSLLRLLLDLLLPSLIFCLLLAPGFAGYEWGLNYVAWIVFIYFLVSMIYAYLLGKEDQNSDPHLLNVSFVAFLIAIVGNICNYTIRCKDARITAVYICVITSVIVWAFYNLSTISAEMRKPNPNAPSVA